MSQIQLKVIRSYLSIVFTLKNRLRSVLNDERGDVPGWVLITVMTAGLVVGIWAIAGPQLKTV
ncbi:MAG: hypothetical protein EBQ72_02110, partial [Actinobacteria bacterium]|nr:hypothetical protein [Actinomycetota bacterium]